MNSLVKKLFLFVLIVLSAIGISSGCRKKVDTIAIIHVKNAGDEPVAGAQVVLYGQSTINQPANVTLYDTTLSNSSGDATFNFNDVYQLGQAGVAILNIKAKLGSAVGNGIIKIEEEKTVEETVFIQ